MGAATTNFAEALPTGDADAAQAATKDPYILDFATSLIPGFGERQLEFVARRVPQLEARMGEGS